MPEVTLLAPAKINLGLEVLRRRDDGFHDINTVFAAVGVYDRITLAPRSDDAILCRVEGNDTLETGEGNLCVRAARLLRQIAGGTTPGLDITLRKRIPMGAGLGGGSSDAAAVLRGLPRIWGITVGQEKISRLALELGSDVPFFLQGGVAHASSRGEVLTPLDLQLPMSVLLVNPGIHVPTPWAYREIGRTGERPATDLAGNLRLGLLRPELLRDRVVNDFEPGVFAGHPLLAEIKRGLYDAGALFALMSGSGSTLFGLFPDRAAAESASARFSEHWTAVADFRTPV